MNLLQRNKHLLHRASFGPGPLDISDLESQPTDVLLERLMTAKVKPIATEAKLPSDIRRVSNSFLNQASKGELRKTDQESLQTFRNEWIYRMAADNPSAFVEKMTLFWHGHFACQCKTSLQAKSYLITLRKHTLGHFGELLLAIAKEPAMIRYLNNQQNRKDHPNENFARELLELFTLGEGHYSEKDIKEAARAFTGWSSNRAGQFVFRKNLHDYGVKSFMGQEGRFNGEDIIKIILQNEQTAQFISTKLFRFFVNDIPQSKHIDELSTVLYESNYDISSAIHHLFSSDWFYAHENVGTMIKSPIDLIAQVIKLLNIKFEDDKALSFLQRGLGQKLFNPPNVAGWPGGRSWINNATLMLRLNLTGFLFGQKRFDHATATPLKAMEATKPLQYLRIEHNTNILVSEFSSTPRKDLEKRVKEVLLAVKNTKVHLSTNKDEKAYDYPIKLIIRIMSMPEFQLS